MLSLKFIWSPPPIVAIFPLQQRDVTVTVIHKGRAQRGSKQPPAGLHEKSRVGLPRLVELIEMPLRWVSHCFNMFGKFVCNFSSAETPRRIHFLCFLAN